MPERFNPLKSIGRILESSKEKPAKKPLEKIYTAKFDDFIDNARQRGVRNGIRVWLGWLGTGNSDLLDYSTHYEFTTADGQKISWHEYHGEMPEIDELTEFATKDIRVQMVQEALSDMPEIPVYNISGFGFGTMKYLGEDRIDKLRQQVEEQGVKPLPFEAEKVA